MQAAQALREPAPEIHVESGKFILFYDGVCVMCNDGLKFVTEKDHNDAFRFAPVQSRFAHDLLTRHGRNPDDLDTMYIVIDYGTPQERLVWKHKAVTFMMSKLRGQWFLSKFLALMPTSLGDWNYDRQARGRYERYGKYDTCPVPPPEVRRKLLTLE
jgi:predicted DCC family thiol-disulfide oxidoreductase YuxK